MRDRLSDTWDGLSPFARRLLVALVPAVSLAVLIWLSVVCGLRVDLRLLVV